MVTTLTATESLERVRQSVKPKDDTYTARLSEAANLGDVARQGDLYFEVTEIVAGKVRVFDRDGTGKITGSRLLKIKLVKNPSLQLAPGTTQGSRHCLDSLNGVKVYQLKTPTPLDGPVLDLAEERSIPHPDHGHWILPPRAYNVTYQRHFAGELRRVQD